jgi:hypothetical protein
MTLFQRLLKVRKKVIFRKPKRFIGECRPDRIFVALKARRLSPAQIYLHELIHTLKPQWSETMVLAMERRLWITITPRERYALYGKLFRHPYSTKEGDDE